MSAENRGSGYLIGIMVIVAHTSCGGPTLIGILHLKASDQHHNNRPDWQHRTGGTTTSVRYMKLRATNSVMFVKHSTFPKF